jgi:uncharacterized membrane protein YraQ (UPF0718 family)
MAMVSFFLAAAPYLLFGLFTAGLLHQFLPGKILQKYLKGDSFWTITKSALIGTPIPLCSCGVIPTALTLHKKGLSTPATSAFLIATPENGVDSISVTYSFFGWPFMIIRVLSAITISIVTGVLIKIFANDNSSNQPVETLDISNDPWRGFRFIVMKFLPETVNWLFIGFLLAGIIASLNLDLSSINQTVSLFWIAIVGTLIYVCASASTPIAAALVASGLSPGAALVFLLTGPATNITNFPILVREFGFSVVVIQLVSIISTSILFGYLVNLAAPFIPLNLMNHAEHHEHMGTLDWFFGGILFSLMFHAFLQKNFRYTKLFIRQP